VPMLALRVLSNGHWMTAVEVAAAIEKSPDNVREHLHTLAARGVIEKVSLPSDKGKGTMLLWRRVTSASYTCPDCGAVLSRYNPLPWCALHAAAHMTHEEYMDVA
jgi:predicted ArsR family transcriptional regulator